MNGAKSNGTASYIGIDVGTTNTRVWLVNNGESTHRVSATMGVRDTAKSGNIDMLKSTLRELNFAAAVEGDGIRIIPKVCNWGRYANFCSWAERDSAFAWPSGH